MACPVIELEKTLKDEIDIYHKLYGLEERKSRAIVERDGKYLESLSAEQEGLLSLLARQESRRKRLIEEYKTGNRLDDLSREVTLKEIVRSMDEDSSHKLLRLGMDLRRGLIKMKSLQETNRKLIEDNMEFFDILLSNLKSFVSLKTGYSVRGIEENRVSSSLLFNKTF